MEFIAQMQATKKSHICEFPAAQRARLARIGIVLKDARTGIRFVAIFPVAPRAASPIVESARGYGLRTGEPRQGRNAATVTFFALP